MSNTLDKIIAKICERPQLCRDDALCPECEVHKQAIIELMMSCVPEKLQLVNAKVADSTGKVIKTYDEPLYTELMVGYNQAIDTFISNIQKLK